MNYRCKMEKNQQKIKDKSVNNEGFLRTLDFYENKITIIKEEPTDFEPENKENVFGMINHQNELSQQVTFSL